MRTLGVLAIFMLPALNSCQCTADEPTRQQYLASLLDGDHKARAAEELALLGNIPSNGAKALIGILQEVAPEYQPKRYLEALRHGGPEVAEQLIKLLSSDITPRDFVKFATLLSSMSVTGRKGIPILQKKVNSSDLKIVVVARIALANLGSDTSEHLREIAKLASEQTTGPYAALAFRELVMSENWLSTHIEDIYVDPLRSYRKKRKLVQMESDEEQELVSFRDAYARVLPVLLLLSNRGKDIIPALEEIQEDTIRDRSIYALSYTLALVRLDKESAQKHFMRLFKSMPELMGRASPLIAFDECYRYMDAGVSAELATMIKRGNDDSARWAGVLLRYSGLRGRNAQHTLIKVVEEDPRSSRRQAAAFSLGGIAEAESVARLQKALANEKDGDVSESLRESIRQILMK